VVYFDVNDSCDGDQVFWSYAELQVGDVTCCGMSWWTQCNAPTCWRRGC